MPQVNPREGDPSIGLVKCRQKTFSKIMSQAVKYRLHPPVRNTEDAQFRPHFYHLSPCQTWASPPGTSQGRVLENWDPPWEGGQREGSPATWCLLRKPGNISIHLKTAMSVNRQTWTVLLLSKWTVSTTSLTALRNSEALPMTKMIIVYIW